MSFFETWKKLFLTTLARNLWILWPLQIFFNYVDQKLVSKIELQLASTQGTSGLWLLIPLSLFINLCLPILSLIIVLYTPWKQRHPQSSLLTFLKTNFERVLKETIRSWGKVLMWTLLFILPGLYKILEYSLVPLIVVFHPKYQDGEIDALDASKKIFRRHFLKIGGLFLLFAIILPIIFSSFDKLRHFQTRPGSASLFSLLETLLSVSFALLLYTLFDENLRKSPSGTTR